MVASSSKALRPAAGALAALALCSCGGASSVDGQVGGMGIDARDVLAMVTPGGGPLSLWIGDHDGLCDEMHGSQFLKNLHMVVLTVGVIKEDGTLRAPDSIGTYPLAGVHAPGQRFAAADFWQIGACLHEDPLPANAGSVTLSKFQYDGGTLQVEGTFSVQFFGGELSGHFGGVIPCTVERGFLLLCK